MSKARRPRLCVYTAMPYDNKRRVQPNPHLLMRGHTDDLEQFLKDCVSRALTFVANKKVATLYIGLETEEDIFNERKSRQWNGVFGTTIGEFLREHITPFFEEQAQAGQRKAA